MTPKSPGQNLSASTSSLSETDSKRNNGRLICRICEKEVVSAKFAVHSKSCSAYHQFKEKNEHIDTKLEKYVHLLRKMAKVCMMISELNSIGAADHDVLAEKGIPKSLYDAEVSLINISLIVLKLSFPYATKYAKLKN